MFDDAPSKTQRKKQMHELQDLGTELVRLSDEHLAALELPERLHDAVVEARGMTKHGALRRQMQFIGKLMRNVDAGPIRERIAGLNAASHAAVARLHLIEDWRTKLLAEPGALAAFMEQHPGADRERLQELIRGVGDERASGRPPRKFRELFQALRDIITRDGAA
ncbi:MAG TPA: ribosome biogenesis factor YjgA [Burkholderiales bacterium]|nr:ribosome biogenesis factor YjgA [Burkholderiales bacterium]